MVTAFCLSALGVQAQQAAPAQITLIHNSPDAAASTVNVYVADPTGAVVDSIKSFNYQDAISYNTIPVPTAGIELTAYITGANATAFDTASAVLRQRLTVEGGKAYVVVASGVTGNTTGPGLGMNTGLELLATEVSSMGPGAGQAGLLIHHGSPDAPAVDALVYSNGQALVEDAPYKAFTNLINVPAGDYPLNVLAADSSAQVGFFQADVSPTDADTVVVFASGFANPNNISNYGNGFQLRAHIVDASNNTVEASLNLPALTEDTASVQVVHNAADPAAASVDVYAKGGLLLDDFAFRTATPYVDVPFLPGYPVSIGVAGGSSASADDTLANFDFTLMDGFNYQLIANGVLDTADFVTGVNNGIGFNIFVNAPAQKIATEGESDLKFFHGVTDAPSVDAALRVQLRGGEFFPVDTLAGLSYGNQTPYVGVPDSFSYNVDVYPSPASDGFLLTTADSVRSLSGRSATVLASGFLSPEDNNNGPSFAFIKVDTNGNVDVLRNTSAGIVQLVHNSPDPAAASVDVYMNDQKVGDDVAFRDVTALGAFPATGNRRLKVALPSSTGPNDGVVDSFDVTNILPGRARIIVIQGLVDPSAVGMFPNDGIPRELSADVYINSLSRGSAPNQNGVSVTLIHGSPDAPPLTIDFSGGVSGSFSPFPYRAGSNLDGGNNTGVIGASDVTADITVASSGDSVGTFDFPLSQFGGQILTVFASGFVDTAANNVDGDLPFAFIVANQQGNTNVVTSVEELEAVLQGVSMYPNPVNNDRLFLSFDVQESLQAEVSVYDMTGRQVMEQDFGRMAPGFSRQSLDVSALEAGQYLLQVRDQERVKTMQFSIVR